MHSLIQGKNIICIKQNETEVFNADSSLTIKLNKKGCKLTTYEIEEAYLHCGELVICFNLDQCKIEEAGWYVLSLVQNGNIIYNSQANINF